MLIGWIKMRREAARTAQVDADALIFANGVNAYAEARRRERSCLVRDRQVQDGRDRNHWRRVAGIVAEHAGR